MAQLKIDPHSALWLSLKAFYEERAADLRARLEGDLDHEETIKVRARLAEVKTLLELPTAEEPLVDQDFELPG
jgi:hypothetical protein